MSRRKLIAGNWKMHKTIAEALELVKELKHHLGTVRDRDVVVAPPYTALAAVRQSIKDTAIGLAAQDIYHEDQGAFTGAISGPMLREAGCTHVLVGHSERRQLFGETLESSRLRTHAAWRAGLVPILCVGESLAERERDDTAQVVSAQLDAALEGASHADLKRLVIAYEPVWAIGTGKVATPQQAQAVHHLIRERLRHRDVEIAQNLCILYGGSVKPDNAKELLNQSDIDGALVGGASLVAASFVDIVKAGR